MNKALAAITNVLSAVRGGLYRLPDLLFNRFFVIQWQASMNYSFQDLTVNRKLEETSELGIVWFYHQATSYIIKVG
jgi:hypothetical protein